MYLDEINYLKQQEPSPLTPHQLEVVEAAREWIGTKFHHQGRVKGVGVDCLGLVVGVTEALRLTTNYQGREGKRLPFKRFDIVNYSREPDGVTLRKTLDMLIDPVADFRTIQPADIALFVIKERPQHLGIIGNYNGLSIIHALEATGKVAEHGLNDTWCKRIVALYRLQPGNRENS